MKKIMFFIFLIVLFFGLTACQSGGGTTGGTYNPDDNPTEQPNENDQVKPIGKKSDQLQLDFISFTILNVNLEYSNLNKDLVYAVEVKIDRNFNNMLGIETDYSKYLDKIIEENKTLKLVVSKTYNKYLKRGDSFIYKLEDTTKIIVNENIEEVFTTINNEYTLLPIVGENIYLSNVTSSISFISDLYYDMDTIILQRDVYYGYDLENHFINYDYSGGYIDYYKRFLVLKPTLSRFEDILKGLSNEDKDFFYKLNYSLFFKLSVFDSDRITIVDEYLNDIGGK